MSTNFLDELERILSQQQPEPPYDNRHQLHDLSPSPRKTESELEAERVEYLSRRRESVRRNAPREGWPLRALESADVHTNTDAVQKAMAWDYSARNVAVLSGPPGTGKTVAAATWMLHTTWDMQFVRSATFAASSRYDQETRERWFGATGLVLDDLGAEYLDGKGSFMVDLDELIDTYYGNRRPLIITTNLTADEFKKRYGSRVEDRIRECAQWITVAGASMRRAT